MRSTDKKTILLLGGGGREHAIARSLAASPRCAKLYIAPGNAGTALVGENVTPGDFAAIREFVLGHGVELVVVGPEEPLVKGLVDFFAADERLGAIPVVGPSGEGARLEGSKDFAKAFMSRHGIPTAAYRTFTSAQVAEGEAFLETLKPPFVLKADGLAAGKGVVIPETPDEAKRELREMLGGKFGEAGARVVIEEFLDGIECSVFVATDGANYKILPTAKDYKRVGDGDTGPNTGGMGAVSPVPFADPDTAAGKEFMRKVEERIIKPTVEGLAAEKIAYRGFIFIGLMNVGGEPWVIEYNVRMGDPETEVVFPRITSDAVSLMEAIATGTLDRYELTVSPLCAATVVATSAGYPGLYIKGLPINGNISTETHIAENKRSDTSRLSTIVFHAGTALKPADGPAPTGNHIVTSGGRVLAVTSLAPSLDQALAASYKRLSEIDFKGMYFRHDIGEDLK